MRKFLSILASVSLVASLPTSVVSCGKKKSKDTSSGTSVTAPVKLTSASYSYEEITIKGNNLFRLVGITPFLSSTNPSNSMHLNPILESKDNITDTLKYRLDNFLNIDTYTIHFLALGFNLSATFSVTR